MELAAYPCQNQLSHSYRCDKRKSYPPRGQQASDSVHLCRRSGFTHTALFGLTAKEWCERNPDTSGNIRDYAGLEQLVVLSNLESINALLIKQGLSQSEQLIQLNKTAIAQMKTLVENRAIKRLERKKHT